MLEIRDCPVRNDKTEIRRDKQIMKKYIYGLTIATSLVILSFSLNDKREDVIKDNSYRLVFADEFNLPNGSQPDSTKWKRCRRNPSRWARWISDSKDVVYIKNGRLLCRAIPNKDLKTDTATMLTGAVETMDLFDFTYGKVEVRMRTNVKSGNSPAAWIRNDPKKHKLYSEIDIMESFGKKKETIHTIHSEYTVNTKKHGERNQFRKDIDITKWHVYGIIWTPTEVVWTIDGKETGRYRKSTTTSLLSKHQWTFDQPMFIRLNQSLCNGNMGLYPDTKATYVTEFDWIRVYKNITNMFK